MRVPRTLYLIADGGRARYVERTGPGHFSTFREFTSIHLHEKASELVRDKPARVQQSATTARHAIERRDDPRDKIEQDFMRMIAADLRDDGSIGSFDNLVVVAPATLSKVLRESLPATFAAKLAQSIDKDLTRIPDVDLYRHLPVFLAKKRAAS